MNLEELLWLLSELTMCAGTWPRVAVCIPLAVSSLTLGSGGRGGGGGTEVICLVQRIVPVIWTVDPSVTEIFLADIVISPANINGLF